ncbi:helix-turn-helix domain-containing protein [Endothiovibrio diazotrophicus]
MSIDARDPLSDWGARLRAIRERAELDQEEFGSVIGTSRSSVVRWESSASAAMDVKRLAALHSRFPQSDLHYLITGEAAPERNIGRTSITEAPPVPETPPSPQGQHKSHDDDASHAISLSYQVLGASYVDINTYDQHLEIDKLCDSVGADRSSLIALASENLAGFKRGTVLIFEIGYPENQKNGTDIIDGWYLVKWNSNSANIRYLRFNRITQVVYPYPKKNGNHEEPFASAVIVPLITGRCIHGFRLRAKEIQL